jgi:hypothetical protein
VGTVVPWIIQALSPSLRYLPGYSMVHVFNPLMTLAHLADRPTLPLDGYALMMIVAPTAGVVFLLNLPSVVREVRHVRIAAPPRVVEEEAGTRP